jgi:hypothetical protein
VAGAIRCPDSWTPGSPSVCQFTVNKGLDAESVSGPGRAIRGLATNLGVRM